MKKPILKLTGLLILFFGIYYFASRESSKNINYLEEVNLQLTGRVTNIVKLKQGHSYGILTLKINSSSIDYYDERDSRHVYFGVIKNDKAEIAVSFASIVNLQDSIIINGINYKIFREDKLIKKGIWDLPSDFINNPYNEISRKLKL